jgi:hypothetical protein
MNYRVQFLDGSARIISDAHDTPGALEIIEGLDWPANAIRMRVFTRTGAGFTSG